jgi:hypothetical protein
MRKGSENQNSSVVANESPGPALAVRHCGDTYSACCLPYKTTVFPNGWCNCNCGDCRVAKYAVMGDKSK